MAVLEFTLGGNPQCKPRARFAKALRNNELRLQKNEQTPPARRARGTAFRGESASYCFEDTFRVAEARRRRPTNRVIASTIAAGLARFFPAISNAAPCATEEKSTGVPIVRPATRCGASSFAATWPWSWNITT